MTRIITGTTTTTMVEVVTGMVGMGAGDGIGITVQTVAMKAEVIIVGRIGRGVVGVEGMGVKKPLLECGTVR